VEGCKQIQEMAWRLVEVDRFGSNPVPVVNQPVPYVSNKVINFAPKAANQLKLIRTGGSFGDVYWQVHEHPFKYLQGEKYDQTTGNRVCGNKWLEMPATETAVIGRNLKNSVTAKGEFEIQGSYYQIIGAKGGMGLSGTTDIEDTTTYKLFVKKALDGANIYQQWHIWYHAESNICVANQ
jgi:hypothetical protein